MNCIGWSAYGLMRKDFFIYFANVSGEVMVYGSCLLSNCYCDWVRDFINYYRTGAGAVLCFVIDDYPILTVHEQ